MDTMQHRPQWARLKLFFERHPRVALGYSGGADSSFLLHSALACGADAQAYFVKSAFQPQRELEEALASARRLGVEVAVLPLDILNLPEVARNAEDRCYHCKLTLFRHILRQAERDGYPVVIDGTHAGDRAEDRPGMRALTELGVLSPLRDAGLVGEDIRLLAKAAGLPTWNKPAFSCLATRIPTGRPCTAELLRRVEGAEAVLRDYGFSDCRVRVFHDAARLELKPSQMALALDLRAELLPRLYPYFSTVLLDLAGR